MSDAIRVLIVDDEEDFRTNLVKLLGISPNITAEAVGSGEAALEWLAANPCDVVLLDVKMPGLAAHGTLKRIRDANYPVEVIILTGHASVDDAVELMNLGAFDYLLKPCSTREIVKKVTWAFESHTGKK